MKIAIGSGKGGTGKTTLSLGLALSLAGAGKPVQYLDCDVEEPNAHLFLDPRSFKQDKIEVSVPIIDQEKCTACKKCSDFCEFNALAVVANKVLIFEEMCHSCGGCWIICPTKAITEGKRDIGKIYYGDAKGLKLIYGELNIGEAQATPLIRAVKNKADPTGIIIMDAPPGTACPFVEAVNGTDFCILVTEPTPFGLYDMKLAAEVVEVMGIPYGVVINRSDIGSTEVRDFCKQKDIPILMEIHHDRAIAVAYSNGITIPEALPEYKEKFNQLYEEIDERIGHYKR